MFSIFINDLDVGLANKVLQFADDTKIWGKVDTLDEINTLKNDITTLEKWSVRNKMPFNVAKTKVLRLGRKNGKHDYSLMGTVLNVTKEERDLGVTFNESFSPSINCIKVSKASNIVIGLIKRNINIRSKEGMLILYKTLVRPLLDYCVLLETIFKERYQYSGEDSKEVHKND